jgi:hypothetical protein
MAQQSARRGRKNQIDPSCPRTRDCEMVPVRELPYGPAASSLHYRPDRWQHPTLCQNFQIPLATEGASTDEGPSIGLTRKFKPPKQSDRKQWEKVEALVRHGFLFWSLGEPYPETLREVPAFVARHAAFVAKERARRPEAYRHIEAALSAIS